ncbi:cob(I)yrinic acid a,c-diamide adenosyltransferase [Acetobacterium tundrae]|uniref:Corrinoid adenosyltransferase n=1 Tax=Acetobacterium tundrae TaxID=132932 RepID=A0ABR6WL02_9FIRM|nr:cob(I)yrinic acid a,c-diamide adenosyltransferase [Acetobacterium tundrae]MBC3797183.1 cob(I)yrinic acid a,c-diamide adenosyltransferase [Acetobacterium tundrae]
MPNVYTRSGDKGETGLFGSSRTPKDDIRVDAYGTMDEANSAIGLAYSLSEDQEIREILHYLQKRIFVLGAELASDEKGKLMLTDRITQDDVDYMEDVLDHYLAIIGPQKKFIIPGANPSSAALHVARTVVRRGERLIVTYNRESEGSRPELVKFVNRLSDTLFVLARTEEFYGLIKEVVSRVEDKLAALGQTEEAEVDSKCQKFDYSLLTLAKKMAAAARVKAIEINVPIVFSVVDTGGNLAYFERMEDSLLGSIDISVNKAFTANALKMPTDQLPGLVKEKGSLYGIQWTNNGRMVVFGGGYPLKYNGKIIGAIGVSGGTVDEDMTIAQAGLAALK